MSAPTGGVNVNGRYVTLVYKRRVRNLFRQRLEFRSLGYGDERAMHPNGWSASDAELEAVLTLAIAARGEGEGT